MKYMPKDFYKKEWFKAVWEGAINPFYIFSKSFFLEKKYYGLTKDIYVYLFKGESFWVIHDKANSFSLGKKVVKKIFGGKIKLDEIKNGSDSFFKALEKYFNLVRISNLEKMSDGKIYALYKRVTESVMGQFGWTAMCEPIGLYLEKAAGDELSEDDIQYKNIIFISKKSFVEKQEISLLNIAKEIYQENDSVKKIKGFNDFKKNLSEKTLKKIKNHKEKYFWINNNYARTFDLPEDYFIKNIFSIVKNNSLLQIKAKLEENKSNLLQSKLINKLKNKERLLKYLEIGSFFYGSA